MLLVAGHKLKWPVFCSLCCYTLKPPIVLARCLRSTWKDIATLKSTQAPTLAPTTYCWGRVCVCGGGNRESNIQINKWKQLVWHCLSGHHSGIIVLRALGRGCHSVHTGTKRPWEALVNNSDWLSKGRAPNLDKGQRSKRKAYQVCWITQEPRPLILPVFVLFHIYYVFLLCVDFFWCMF